MKLLGEVEELWGAKLMVLLKFFSFYSNHSKADGFLANKPMDQVMASV